VGGAAENGLLRFAVQKATPAAHGTARAGNRQAESNLLSLPTIVEVAAQTSK
jgi:hypothetical protein